MPEAIGASGIVGISLEAVAGTYVAPTKFFPILRETMSYNQELNWRRSIRGVADIHGVVPGNVAVEGDVEIEGIPSVIAYFLHAMRGAITKTDDSGSAPYTYELVPTHAARAVDGQTLSLTIIRGTSVFAYTGVAVSQAVFSIENGMLKAVYSCMGFNEETQSTPGAITFAPEAVVGAGMYTVEIPTSTQVYDVDTFQLTINDNGEQQYRLRDDRLGPSYMKWGERAVQLTAERDFVSKVEYDAYKALTAQAVTIECDISAVEFVHFNIFSAIKDTYEISLSGQGDLLRGRINYEGVYNTTATASYGIEVGTAENIGS